MLSKIQRGLLAFRLGKKTEEIDREAEIVAKILCGETNEKIAEEMNLSLGSIKKTISEIYQKLNCKCRIDLAGIMFRLS